MDYTESKSGKYVLRTYENGNKRWYLNDELHREDGPAVIFTDGHKEWYLNDKLHREDGPAIEHRDGTKFWYLKGSVVYCSYVDYLSDYPDVSDAFKRSVIRYKLRNM